MRRKRFTIVIFRSSQRFRKVRFPLLQATSKFTFVFLLALLAFFIEAQAKPNKKQNSSPTIQVPSASQRDTEIENIKQAIRESSKAMQDDLTKIKADIQKTSYEGSLTSIIGSVFGIIVGGGIAFLTLKKSSKDFKDQTAKLKEQIENIEEVTSKRHIQEGFSQVFKKAEYMLENSQNFCWMLNFTAYFGQIHVYNSSVYNTPEWVSRQEMENRVNQFKLALQWKAANKAVDFKLVYLKEEDFDSEFLNPIAEKPNSGIQGDGSEKIKDEIRRKNNQALASIRQDLVEAGQNPEHRLIPVSKIPLQMFITDIKIRDDGANSTAKTAQMSKACLVFFVGTENATSAVRGIYTEHPPLVELFKNIFEDIARHP